MTDIVERLRACHGIEAGDPECCCAEAADEIERLRKIMQEQAIEWAIRCNDAQDAARNDALEEAAKVAEDSNRAGHFKTPSARSFAGLYGRELADAIRALKESILGEQYDREQYVEHGDNH